MGLPWLIYAYSDGGGVRTPTPSGAHSYPPPTCIPWAAQLNGSRVCSWAAQAAPIPGRRGLLGKLPKPGIGLSGVDRAGVLLWGSGPVASLQEEPDVLCKQETVISSLSNGRRAAYILCWGTP